MSFEKVVWSYWRYNEGKSKSSNWENIDIKVEEKNLRIDITPNDGKIIDKKSEELKKVIECFNAVFKNINSSKNKLKSNEVLAEIYKNENLEKKYGYKIEHKKNKIKLLEFEEKNSEYNCKLFQVDAYNDNDKANRILVEIEGGRAYANNQFLKDFFEAIVSTKVDYLIIAVRVIYQTKIGKTNDFEKINEYFDALFTSENSNNLPLKGILLIGY